LDNTEDKCGCGELHEGEGGCENHDENGCGCGHDHEENVTVTLTLDDDSELECSILGTFDIEEVEYIALLPIDDGEVLIYRYEQNDEDVTLGLIESDEEFEMVSEAFHSIFGDLDDYEVEFEDDQENEENEA